MPYFQGCQYLLKAKFNAVQRGPGVRPLLEVHQVPDRPPSDYHGRKHHLSGNLWELFGGSGVGRTRDETLQLLCF